MAVTPGVTNGSAPSSPHPRGRSLGGCRAAAGPGASPLGARGERAEAKCGRTRGAHGDAEGEGGGSGGGEERSDGRRPAGRALPLGALFVLVPPPEEEGPVRPPSAAPSSARGDRGDRGGGGGGDELGPGAAAAARLLLLRLRREETAGRGRLCPAGPGPGGCGGGRVGRWV